LAPTSRADALITTADVVAASQTRDTIAHLARSLLAVDSIAAAPIENRFRIAGLDLSVRFGDPVIAAAYASRLSPSKAGGAGADHRLIVLHASNLNWPSAPAWKDKDCSPRQFHAVIAGDGLKIAYPFSARLWHVYEPRTRRGVQLSGSRADLPPWDFGVPLRQHLHWLLAEHGLRLTHAATLGRNGRGVLIVGDGGAGKSATALAGIAAGMTSCGDDYVALGGGTQPMVHLLFRILKQDRAGLSRVPALNGRTDNLPLNWQGKVEFDPEAFFPGCLAERLAIDAVLLPCITRRETARIVPISRGEIMRAMMRSNLYQFPGEDDDGLAFFARILAQLPCFRVDLAVDPAENANVIDKLLQDVRP
jgi:hypothetical protein